MAHNGTKVGRSLTPCSRSRHLLNDQLLLSMQDLDVPRNVQERVMHLPTKQKRSMLELYTRQRRHDSNSHLSSNKKHKRKSSMDALDVQLLHRMNELYVPKHIQSQIITLPKQKKRILLAKYNNSPPAPVPPQPERQSSEPSSRSVSNPWQPSQPLTSFALLAPPSESCNTSNPAISDLLSPASLVVNRNDSNRNPQRMPQTQQRPNIVLPSELHQMQTLKKREFVQILSNQKQHSQARTAHRRRYSDSSVYPLPESEHKLGDKHKANSMETSQCKFHSDSVSQTNSRSHSRSRSNSHSVSITGTQSDTYSPDMHTQQLQEELFQIMDNFDRVELVSEPGHSKTLHTQQTLQTVLVHPDADSITISQMHDSEDDDNTQQQQRVEDTEETDEEKLEMCLRCLRRMCVDDNDDNKYTKCQFHAFLSESPDYSNTAYFVARNEELWQARDFNFVCCDRRCKGAFRDETSQTNGCRIVYSHLFASQIEGASMSSSTEMPINGHHTRHSTLRGVSRDVTLVDMHQGQSKVYRSQNQFEDLDEEQPQQPSVINLCGKWKVFMYVDDCDTVSMICNVHIMRHSQRGRIEAKLVSVNAVSNENDADQSNDGGFYCGQLNSDQLVLRYNGSYSASYVLNVEQYELNGDWVSSRHRKGTCQWFKMQKLLLSQ